MLGPPHMRYLDDLWIQSLSEHEGFVKPGGNEQCKHHHVLYPLEFQNVWKITIKKLGTV